MRKGLSIGLLALLLVGGSSASWAWRGGFRGPRFSVYLGPGPYWPYWPVYDPYYDPYYAYAYPYSPYTYPPYRTYDDYENHAPAQPASPDTPRQNVKTLSDEIRRARDSVKFQYDDGDISKEEMNVALRHIDDVQNEARSEADANGGALTNDQKNALLQALRSGGPVEKTAATEPAAPAEQTESPEAARPALPNLTPLPGTSVPANEQPHQDLKAVNVQIAHLRTLLDKKVANGDITKPQQKAESGYLDQLEKLAQAQAAANNGKISPRQESSLLQELQHVEHLIQKNLVSN